MKSEIHIIPVSVYSSSIYKSLEQQERLSEPRQQEKSYSKQRLEDTSQHDQNGFKGSDSNRKEPQSIQPRNSSPWTKIEELLNVFT